MRLEGKTILITGSTDGVGRVVAKRLAAEGANVLVHGRSQARAEQVLREICGARVTPKKGMATFYQADFASLAEVRRLAETILQERERIDCLVNNAGIGSGADKKQRELSKDGYELRFAVNYLAGFMLTRLLLPRIVESPPARIVNVSSLGQQAIDFGDVMLERGYNGTRAYCQSKLAEIMFTIDLANELDPKRVTANALHPATYMNTTMVRESGNSPVSSVEEGADAIMKQIVSEDLAGKSGLFFNGQRESRADPQAYDAEARAKLKALSMKLVGLG
ncbi:MAG TPA: SDR family NAD(P)-dependent oxidoreductase [Xanthobacteraceae bacterium]|nr:SDR family NAD(P)-dependent oxidoreductase [Xanthobacteraceae bacterium]